MSISSLVNRSCTIVRKSDTGTDDAYGNPVASETLVQTVCEVQQRSRDEVDGEVSATEWVGFFLPSVTIDTSDEIDVDGLGTFQVVGSPWVARNPRTQANSHIEASLEKVAGAEDS